MGHTAQCERAAQHPAIRGQLDQGSGRHDGIVAVPASVFDKAMAAVRGPRFQAHRGEQFVGVQAGAHQAQSEVAHGHGALRALARDGEFAIHGHGHGRDFGRGVQVAEAAAHRPPAAGLVVTDVAHRLAQQRQGARHQGRLLKFALAGHGAYDDAIALLRHAAELRNAVEIDQVIDPGQAQVEHGHQRLAACDGAGVSAASQHRQRLVQGARQVQMKRCGFHGRPKCG